MRLARDLYTSYYERKVYKMTYKEIMEHIKFHRERIDELSDKIHNADNTDVRKAIIDEMMWRAEEVGKLDAWLTYQTSILKPPIRKIYN